MRHYKEEGILIIEGKKDAWGEEFIEALKDLVSSHDHEDLLLLFDGRNGKFRPTMEEQGKVSRALHEIQKKHKLRVAVLLKGKEMGGQALAAVMMDRAFGVKTKIFSNMKTAKNWLHNKI